MDAFFPPLFMPHRAPKLHVEELETRDLPATLGQIPTELLASPVVQQWKAEQIAVITAATRVTDVQNLISATLADIDQTQNALTALKATEAPKGITPGQGWKAENSGALFASFSPALPNWSEPDVSADGKSLFMGTTDGRVLQYAISTGTLVREFKTAPMLDDGFGFSSDQTKFFTIDPDRRGLTVWDAGTGKQLQRWTYPNVIGGVNFSPDGSRIGLGAAGNPYYLYDLSTGKNILTGSPGSSGGGVSVSNLTMLTSGGDQSRDVLSFDTVTGQALQTYKGISRAVTATGRSPDGKYIVAGGYDGDLVLFDALTGQMLQKISSTGPGYARRIKWNADGTQFGVSRAYRDENPGATGVEIYQMNGKTATKLTTFANATNPGKINFVPGAVMVDDFGDGHTLMAFRLPGQQTTSTSTAAIDAALARIAGDKTALTTQQSDLVTAQTKAKNEALTLQTLDKSVDDLIAMFQKEAEAKTQAALLTAKAAADKAVADAAAQAAAAKATSDAAALKTVTITPDIPSTPAPEIIPAAKIQESFVSVRTSVTVTADNDQLYLNTRYFDGRMSFAIGSTVITPEQGDHVLAIPRYAIPENLRGDLAAIQTIINRQMQEVKMPVGASSTADVFAPSVLGSWTVETVRSDGTVTPLTKKDVQANITGISGLTGIAPDGVQGKTIGKITPRIAVTPDGDARVYRVSLSNFPTGYVLENTSYGKEPVRQPIAAGASTITLPGDSIDWKIRTAAGVYVTGDAPGGQPTMQDMPSIAFTPASATPDLPLIVAVNQNDTATRLSSTSDTTPLAGHALLVHPTTGKDIRLSFAPNGAGTVMLHGSITDLDARAGDGVIVSLSIRGTDGTLREQWKKPIANGGALSNLDALPIDQHLLGLAPGESVVLTFCSGANDTCDSIQVDVQAAFLPTCTHPLPCKNPMGTVAPSLNQNLTQSIMESIDLFNRGAGVVTINSPSADIARALTGGAYDKMAPNIQSDYRNGIEAAKAVVWNAYLSVVQDAWNSVLLAHNGVALPQNTAGISDSNHNLSLAQIPNLPSRADVRRLIDQNFDTLYATTYKRICGDSIEVFNRDHLATTQAAGQEKAVHDGLEAAGLLSVQNKAPSARTLTEQLALDRVYTAATGSPDRAGWTMAELGRLQSLVAAQTVNQTVAGVGAVAAGVPVQTGVGQTLASSGSLVTDATINGVSVTWEKQESPMTAASTEEDWQKTIRTTMTEQDRQALFTEAQGWIGGAGSTTPIIPARTDSIVGRIMGGAATQLWQNTSREGQWRIAMIIERITEIPAWKIFSARQLASTSAQFASAFQTLMNTAQYGNIFEVPNSSLAPQVLAAHPDRDINNPYTTGNIRIRFDFTAPGKTMQYAQVMYQGRVLGGTRSAVFAEVPVSALGLTSNNVQLTLRVHFTDGLEKDVLVDPIAMRGTGVEIATASTPRNWNGLSEADKKAIQDILNIDNFSALPESNQKILTYVLNSIVPTLGFNVNTFTGDIHGTGLQQCKAWLQDWLQSSGITAKSIPGNKVSDLNGIGSYEWNPSTKDTANVTSVASIRGDKSFQEMIDALNPNSLVRAGDIVQMGYGGIPHTMVITKIQGDGVWVLDTNFGPEVPTLADNTHEGTGLIENGKFRLASVEEKTKGLAKYWLQIDNTVRLHFMPFEIKNANNEVTGGLNSKVSMATIYRIES